MRKVFAATAALGLLGLCIAAQAAITIDKVVVGNAGNIGPGYVDHSFSIGKYEVTAGQYTAFLNAVAATDTYGLYNTSMDTSVYSYGCNIKRTGTSGSYSYSVASDWSNRPVNLVSYWDSCRFANWLGNGQPTGLQGISTTERGAYTLDGYNGTDGRAIGRNASAKWAVTSDHEWYKAAYYDPNKAGGAGYWLYPTSSNTAPGRDMADDSGNNANYYIDGSGYLIGSPYYRTEVGEFQNSDSPYGTFDQGGNVWEWTEATISGARRCLRGGSGDSIYELLASSRYISLDPTFEYYLAGFRVSYVPEPSSILAFLGGLVGFWGTRRRKA